MLAALREARTQLEALKEPRDERVAIIGMAARLPGAETVAEFWELLVNGRSGIRVLSHEELREAGVDEATIGSDDYVPAWASFADPTAFDAGLFGYSPREATLLDPQHRVFLECAWAALEDAGHDPEDRDVRVGVYGGAALNAHLVALHRDVALRESVSPVEAVVSNVVGLMPTRVAYHLDLTGPACAVQTGCSTSLVAVHVACRSLLDGDCDVALAGGVTIAQAQPAGYRYQPGGIASPDGACRAFDAGGRGTLFGNGVGIVVLKRLAAALADGDPIRAVIVGSAVNNDGADKVGLLAPSVGGQAAAIETAWRRAGLDGSAADYIEAHGTATELGDPIEHAALVRALAASLSRAGVRCGLGSVKTNLGHLDAAAGVAGLIKTVLALEHETLPASLNFTRPHPQIDFAGGPFEVVAENRPWPRGARTRRAGVSSFGMGGTNAHVVVEEAPRLPDRSAAGDEGWQFLPLSARTPEALGAIAHQLSVAWKAGPDLELGDVAFTLQRGRRPLSERRLVLARDRDEAIAALDAPAPPMLTARAGSERRSLVFMFAGQGGQFPGMARRLSAAEPVFLRALDECAELMAPELDLPALLAPSTDPGVLAQTANAQPILFAFEYALARLWQSRGVRPDAVIGHSVGEYAAACIAEVFSLPDAVRTVLVRGRLMQECEPGAMLAVLAESETVQGYLGDGVELAAWNAPDNIALAGPAEQVDALRRRFEADGLTCRRLEVSHAFHSAAMDPALEPFREHLSGLALNAPSIPLVSNRTGTWLDAEQAIDPDYWVDHLRHPVRFAEGLETLRAHDDPVFLELGPGATLGRFAAAAAGATVAIPSQPPAAQAAHGERWFAQALGRLWLNGIRVDWERADRDFVPRKVSLPTYPFERTRYAPESAPVAGLTNDEPGAARISDISGWFHVPTFERVPQVVDVGDQPQTWVVCGTADLAEPPPGVRIIRAGDGPFGGSADGGVTVDSHSRVDYGRALDDLAAEGIDVTQWVQLPAADGGQDLDALIALAQTIQMRAAPLVLSVVTTSACEVVGNEALQPSNAAAIGLCQVLPQEVPGLQCRVIDVDARGLGPSGDGSTGALMAELAARADWQTRTVALRGRHRWVRRHRATPLPAARRDLLRPGATYAVVGDLLGGLGMVYARLLRRMLGARVILIGRADLPAPGEWERRQATQGALHPVNQFIQRVKELGQEGEHWELHAVDLADGAALAQAIARGTARFGPLAGVFHADVTGDGAACALSSLDPDERSRIMRTKVSGSRALEAALRGHEPQFVVLQSSLSAVVGGAGLAAYAAASSVLDAFAEEVNAKTAATRWVSINWDACRLDDDPPVRASAWLAGALSPDEVWRATTRILAAPDLGQVAVTPWPLPPRLREAFDPASVCAGRVGRRGGAEVRASSHVEPTTAIEKAVAQAISELLGLPEVGRDDDFFALGGNSLLAIQAVTRLRKEFGVDLPMRALLFEDASVAAIARVIEDHLGHLLEEDVVAIEDLLDEIETMSPDEAARKL